ncbi:hypothetical protein FIBSPDRAFT_859647 [Athelia psychrophila]|uniref:Uncharacterized protein n=1 Tax=Athelia psychrophila TaxID=1759441 RepID=A0A166KX66_9AGAM|nr:hypothetical protein FIBSPDRAFT_859647 [Fibularhizoctonia sp. CBS 109695]
MATRSHRRKKGQGSSQDIRDRPDIRERPFTAFGEDPNTSLLVPTPSEQAVPSAGQMSSPFSVASSSGGHNTTSTNNTTPNGNYQSGNYAYSTYGNGNGNGNDSNMNYDGGHTHAQQQHQFNSSMSLPTMPTGRNDLEILERLKAQIKAGQHERFQAKPAPGALLKIYQDGIKSQAAPHPQQGPEGNAAAGSNQHHYDVRSVAPGETGSKNAPAHDASRRIPPIHTPPWDAYDPKRPIDSSPASASQATIKNNPAVQTGKTHGNTSSSSIPPSPVSKLAFDSQKPPMDSKVSLNGSAGSGSDSVQYPHNRYPTGSAQDARAQDLHTSKIDRVPSSDSPAGEYGSRPRATSDASSVRTPFHDGKGDSRPPPARDSWQPNDSTPARDDQRGRPGPDRLGAPPLGRPLNAADSRPLPGDPDARGAPPRDQRFYDRERDRDRERERDRERDRDSERDRDRRPWLDTRRDDRPGDLPVDRPRTLSDARRPPPEERHYEPRYASDMLPRRSDPRPDDMMDVDKRLPPPAARLPPAVDDRSVRPPPPSIDDHSKRPPPLDDRTAPSRSAVDERAPPPRVTANNAQSARVMPPVDERNIRPVNDNRHIATPDDRSLRPLPLSQSQDVPPRLAADRGAQRAPLPPADDRNGRPPVPLEDRIGRGPPSLQERITHPPGAAATRPPLARVDDHLSRPPSLEDRITHPPVHPPAGGDRAPPLRDDRAIRPGPNDRPLRPIDPIRPPPLQSRPDDRSVRPPPSGDRYVRPASPPLRGPGNNAPRSVSVARDDPRAHRPPSPVREYRPPPRPVSRERDLRPAHRPEGDRGFEERRPDLMDADAPPRFNDNRASYVRRPSPPPVADRARSIYPPPPSPPKRGPEPTSYPEPDRRYSTTDRRDWPPLEGKAPPNSGPDEDYYKTRPPSASWDREGLDRDRVIERGAPPARNNGWETREERERRSSFPAPASPSMRPFESAQARPNPTASRLSDTYPTPTEERAYPPKDYDRARYPPSAESSASFSRIRARSPSPISRRPTLPGSVADDGRPPLKRAREDVPYSGPDYYSPDRRAPAPGPPSDYIPARVPPNRATNEPPYYDTRDARSGPPPGSAPINRPAGPPYDRERDYPPARDRASDIGGYAPGPASYDRPLRSSPPPRQPLPPYAGRGNYSRGDPRDDRPYMPPPAPRN